MKNILTIFLIFRTFFCLSTEPELILKIFLNTDNCFSCESSLRLLSELDSSAVAEIHAKKDSEQILGEYLEKFGLNSSLFRIKFHETLVFDKEHHDNSYFQLFSSNTLLATFYGDRLHDYVAGINSLLHKKKVRKKTIRIELGDTIVFSPLLSTLVMRDQINLNDRKLGKNYNYRINPEKTSCLQKTKVLAKELDGLRFFSLTNMDSSFYYKYPTEVKKRGFQSSLHQAYLDGSSLFILFSIPYYYMAPPGHLHVDARLILMKKELSNEKTAFYKVGNYGIRAKDSTTYFIDTSKGIFIVRDTLVFSLFANSYKGEKCYKYVKTCISDDSLKVISFSKVSLARDEVETKKLDDDLFFSNSNSNYSVNHNIIYNYNTGRFVKDSIGHAAIHDVLDVKIAGCFITYLSVQEDDSYHLSTYDSYSWKKISSRRITFGEKTNVLSARIYDDNYLVAVNATGTSFLFKSMTD